MNIAPATNDAYRLFHDGVIALAGIEENGVRIDTTYLDHEIERTKARIKKGEEHLRKSSVWKVWQKRYGSKAKLGSKSQLAAVFFDELGYERNDAGKQQDEAAFANIDHPFIKNYFKVEKLKKVSGTYLSGIRREVVGDRAHVFFNLHTVKTYRGSADRFSYQNLPIRNPEMGGIVRKAFIPSDGHVLVEIDYSGLEFTQAGAITQCPQIRKYIETGGDPHRDMAALVFKCKPEEINKKARYHGKNQFVFPLLYGSYYRSCAPILWAAMKDLDVGGVPMMDRFADFGITELGQLDTRGETYPGTFEHWLKQCEKEYTQVRFKKCFDNQRKAYETYRKTGEVRFVTGFVARGLMSRNDVYNWRIQGPAFHCLLWSLTHLHKWLVKSKKRSMIVGQIHDSIIADVHIDELDEYLQYAKHVMTVKIREHWDWLCVPLEVEAEVTPVGGTWNDKQVYAIR